LTIKTFGKYFLINFWINFFTKTKAKEAYHKKFQKTFFEAICFSETLLKKYFVETFVEKLKKKFCGNDFAENLGRNKF
jgi:hypothetical protein